MTFSIAGPSLGAPRWEDQSVFRVNKEVPHATKMPFATAEEAATKLRMESSWCMLLNGEWKYHWAPTMEQHEKEAKSFYSVGFNDASWGTIPVPSNVELEGHGTPIYSNATYPFAMKPPSVTDDPPADWTASKERSPVSAYRRTFTVPAGWEGRKTFIVFNGVESAFTLYVNGQEVGYSQDSRTPAEFNITPYLKEGENLLAVEVMRWSDGSYLEDQDFWRLSGIFRDVYLWSADVLELRDIEIMASLDETYTKGVLDLKTWVYNFGDKTAKYGMDLSLIDADGNAVFEKSIKGNVFGTKDHMATDHMADLAIKPWSAETPNLYTLQVGLKNEAGASIAHYAFKVGFRTSEIKGGNLLVNGKPILIKGVDRHDHHHITGHYITEETMRAELDLMKRLNINAIRTSHYPNDPRFLELVNEYGFYVISEANIETHGFGADANNLIANDPSWRDPLIDRVKNMVETFKNQPSVIIWSLGNEAGTGPNFEGMAYWIHQRDTSRLVHYEGACRATPGYHYVDFESPMYYNIGSLDSWCRNMEKQKPERQKPLIQCEYSHAMGNSCGGLAEYWQMIRKERLLQGGFIWDWRDQGILQTKAADPRAPAAVSVFDKDRFVNADGSLNYFAFGGDFGDKPNDASFCMNGVVGADLVPNPHATEVAYQYRSILTSGVDLTNAQPVVAVFNENFFTTLKDQPLKWTLLGDGKALTSGEVMIAELAPQSTNSVTIPVPDFNKKAEVEYYLNVEYPQTAKTRWADEGFIIARDQLALGWTQRAVQPYVSRKSGVLGPRKLSGNYVFNAGKISAEIDGSTGQMLSYKIGNTDFLAEPLQLNFWRATVNNDRGSSISRDCQPWKEAGANAKVTKVREEKREGVYDLIFDLDVPAGEAKATVTYSFYGDGTMGVSLKLNAGGKDIPKVIPRVGFQCSINGALNEWSWYGRGPEENYSDRKDGTFVGLWEGNAQQLWFPYADSQGTANRTDVRWAKFARSGHGLMIRPTDGKLLEIEAYPFLQSDLEETRHSTDIPLRKLITVQIALRQMGVGGENSWGAWPRPDHLIKSAEGPYEYSFIIQPF